MAGDHSTGAGGSWKINQDVWVCADSNGDASQMVSDVMAVISQAGYNAINGGVGPDTKYDGVRSGRTNLTTFYLVNGVCKGTCYEFYTEAKQDGWMTSGSNIVVGFQTGDLAVCTMNEINKVNAGSAWDDNFSTASMKSEMVKKSSAQWLEEAPNCGWVAGPDAQSLANAFLTGAGAGGGSGVEIVEGFMTSGRGKSLLTYDEENFTPLTEIPFARVSVTEEDYESPTAEFTSPERIDLLDGMTYVLIQGDPGEFGGIIIKREGPDKQGLYTYTCQDYMTRIMNNQIYAIYNKSKTVYEWITEILEDQGIPTTGLDEVDAYDNVVDPEYIAEIENEELENQSVEEDNNNSDSNNTTDNSTSSTGTSSETMTTTTDEEGNEKVETNPFKKKPRGIYDKQPVVEHIRTLLFDYGVHVRFYGDVTGYPIFKAYPKEEFLEHGWTLSTELGVQTDYKTSMDVTNGVAQVGVKNIEALKPTGELYTASDLLGVKLAGHFGRIGILVDNPTPQGNASAASTNQTMYVDKDGNTYTQDQVISTNGYPSCSNDTSYNNGTKPEYQAYQKYWVNKCPACNAEKTLENKTPNSEEGGKEGKTTCTGTGSSSSTSSTGTSGSTSSTSSDTSSDSSSTKGCGASYCQYCGSGTGGSLTEVWPQNSANANQSNTGSTGGTTAGTSNPSGSSSTVETRTPSQRNL